jgi:pimeloyl-ACP methyl ester carboxylesterase
MKESKPTIIEAYVDPFEPPMPPKVEMSFVNNLAESFAQDIDGTETDIMAVVQKLPNQSIFAEKSGPPAWKQLPAWFQVSENDRIIYPDAERNFAERMNATSLSLNSSHASLVSHPDEIAELILNATKGVTK